VIPDSHNDLVQAALPAVMVTLLKDGRPQASVVWFDVVEDVFRVNSERGRLTDPANDHGHRVIVSIKPMKVVAYG
jgi:hypothetical protein